MSTQQLAQEHNYAREYIGKMTSYNQALCNCVDYAHKIRAYGEITQWLLTHDRAKLIEKMWSLQDEHKACERQLDKSIRICHLAAFDETLCAVKELDVYENKRKLIKASKELEMVQKTLHALDERLELRFSRYNNAIENELLEATRELELIDESEYKQFIADIAQTPDLDDSFDKFDYCKHLMDPLETQLQKKLHEIER